MPLQHELAWLLKQRCEEIGLTSQRLAELSGAEFETVRQLLDGMGCHISISDAECIANAVGLGLGVLGHRRDPQRTQGAAVIAARSASTSLTEPMPPDALIDSLARGLPATEYRPHIRAILEEVPLGLLADLAYELHDRLGTPPVQTWQNMRNMATSLACLRAIWH